MNNAYYVTMTDKFMSGWGPASGKINKLVIECETYEDAQSIAAYAETRDEMKYINIAMRKPHYNTLNYYVSFKLAEDMKTWLVEGRKLMWGEGDR